MTADKNVKVYYESELIKIDHKACAATFREYPNPGGWSGGKTFTMTFAALHVVPPQSAPACVKNSPLAGPDGFVEVDQQTMQHKKFSNVFAIGDCMVILRCKQTVLL